MWLSSGVAARKAGITGAISSSEWAISASPEDFVYVSCDFNFLFIINHGLLMFTFRRGEIIEQLTTHKLSQLQRNVRWINFSLEEMHEGDTYVEAAC